MSEPRIRRDPSIMMGKPVIVGTRITVEHILRLLGAGDSIDQILQNYPQLTAPTTSARRRHTRRTSFCS